MIQCLFLNSRQGKTRLTKWYSNSLSSKEKVKFIKEVTPKLQWLIFICLD